MSAWGLFMRKAMLVLPLMTVATLALAGPVAASPLSGNHNRNHHATHQGTQHWVDC